MPHAYSGDRQDAKMKLFDHFGYSIHDLTLSHLYSGHDFGTLHSERSHRRCSRRKDFDVSLGGVSITDPFIGVTGVERSGWSGFLMYALKSSSSVGSIYRNCMWCQKTVPLDLQKSMVGWMPSLCLSKSPLRSAPLRSASINPISAFEFQPPKSSDGIGLRCQSQARKSLDVFCSSASLNDEGKKAL